MLRATAREAAPFEINARWFAAGDGVTTDDEAIAAAIAAAPSGGAVRFPPGTYKITRPIEVTKALTVRADFATIHQVTGGTNAFSVTASDVHLEGLIVKGPAHAAFQNGASGVSIAGTRNPGAPPTFISNFSARNCLIEGFGELGVYIAYVDGYVVTDSVVTDIGYAGIGIVSGKRGRVHGNVVDTVGPGTGGLSYGIFASRESDDSGELTSQPRSEDWAIVGNVVRNVPGWEGIDTHGGKRGTIADNVIYNTKIGIAVGVSPNSAGVGTYAPLDVSVTGNTADSGLTNGTAGYGAVFQGIVGGEHATGTVSGNTISNYGTQSNASTGSAVYVYGTSGLSITGNSIVNPAWMGINVERDNNGIVVVGNAIVDPWSNTASPVGEADAIVFHIGDNTGVISGNTFTTAGKSATYLLTTATGKGISVSDTAGNAAKIGPNYSVATTYLNDPGARTS